MPPVTVNSPRASRQIRCSREIWLVAPASLASTKGLSPTQTLRTSAGRSVIPKDLWLSRNKKSSSSCSGKGSCGASLRGVSVVPITVEPNQGTANNTRPSLVRGISTASSMGKHARETTMCTPWLGLTSAFTGCAPAPGDKAMRRKASTQTPAALTTQSAFTVSDSPECSLSKLTCQPCCEGVKAVTRVWLYRLAPACRAVLASARASRASSNWPSQ